MLTLEIGNSISKFIGLTAQQLSQLKEILFYTIDPQAMYFSGNFRSPKRYLIDKKGHFPTGLLYLATEWAKSSQYYCEVSDTRKVPNSLRYHYPRALPHTLYPEQEQAVAAAVRAHRGIISAPTGIGKSLMIVELLYALSVKTLIVVPTLGLRDQLTKTLIDAFGEGLVGKDRVFWVSNVDAPDLCKPLIGYKCVIIDEFHHSAAKTYRELNLKCWNDVYYRFGFTATPFRSQDNERLLLESVLSEVIYQVEYQTCVEKGYIAPVEAYYYELPKTHTSKTTWKGVYNDLVVNNAYRNAQIATLLSGLHAQGKSTLCLVKEVEHGKNICRLTEGALAHASDEDHQLYIDYFSRGKLTTLVGTTGVIGEGVDTKPAEYVIIAGLGKSRNQFMQQIGRGVRKYPGKESCKVIIFKDKSHKWTLSHFKAQCMILKQEYGVIPVAL